MIIKAIILVAVCVTVFAGEADTKLPASAQAVLDKATRDVAVERAKYEAAAGRLLDGTEKALKVEMDKFTKAGKLNEALAIQKVLEGLRENVIATVDEKAKGKEDLLGEGKADLAKVIMGTWRTSLGNGTIYIKSGGMISYESPSEPAQTASYKIIDNKVIITWDSGTIITMDRIDRQKMTGSTSANKPVVYTRQD